MAFTGAATIVKVTDSCFRITGLSLGNAAAGTIGLSGATGDVDLLSTVNWRPQGDVTLSDAIEVSVHFAGAVALASPVIITKAGTTVANWLVTLTNGNATVTGALEIYIRFML